MYVYKSKIILSREDLPVWRWSELVTPKSFVEIPPNFTWPEDWEDEPAEDNKVAAIAPSDEPKKEAQLFRYAKIETQYCVDSDLSFCESLAVAYSRILEDKGEKIFLRGNAFVAKIAKAVFEQNENLFADACMKHKDEKYFMECMEELNKLDFTVDKDAKADKNSWINLYETVLLLTGEYLATKCELPKVSASECKDNSESEDKVEIIIMPQSASEEDIKDANIAPLELEREGLYDSSDSVKAGDLFYEFLCENFPFKSDRKKLTEFMMGIYEGESCKDLGWFCDDAASNSFPVPEIKIEAMEDESVLGACKGKTICIDQRLVLDALSLENPDSRFVLLLTMLTEYGLFLDNILHERAGSKKMENGEGMAFASRFMEYSTIDLFRKDFEFSDFIAPDAKGKEQKFKVEVSNLNYEQRKSILYMLNIENI
jgi:hypothetical protein